MSYDNAPSDKIFNEIKQAATEIWQTYDNTYGYVDELCGSTEDGHYNNNAECSQ